MIHTVPVGTHDNYDPYNLGGFDDENNMSKSRNNKVGKFLVGGDVNGNNKFQGSDLHMMRRLSHSEAE